MKIVVALLAEGVDRNIDAAIKEMDEVVALLAEGVDRNTTIAPPSQRQSVALLAEGVDRNFTAQGAAWSGRRSPSSRRAWIEMYQRSVW